ncbi:type II toxin-antitoxin system YafQ family toxin [Candidatus Neptunochlamydia vexilliferae]|uniref:mRNA interferase YafQ n=1 Tax=Candidatus Neptunichlamydia vexilliferae TaxID=1651774 RepID=A0ABS0AZV2_9BACT|nr:type II toxin-antitoxin system YafQ family toxin [Candidatus Neptunochlamydia vexilliferae]MBF5059137.1 mRNA interferase YafQ [Candidatus Neptunochlamydia vexilliferae]
MLEIIRTTQFKRDVKRLIKQRKKLEKLKQVINKLVEEEPLPTKLRNHKLSGNYRGRWECHIEPDWLLIYKLEKKRLLWNEPVLTQNCLTKELLSN